MFSELGFPTAIYDSFFWPDPTPLKTTYDFIVASEVLEHFYQPMVDLELIWTCLKPGAWLGVMTQIFTPETDFSSWYYRRDPTHVVFYSRQTFQWIATHFGFTKLTYVGERIALLQRP